MTAPAGLQFHHGGVSVPDLDAAIRWYGEILGFAVESRFEIPPAHAKVAMLQRDGMRIELFEVENAAPLPVERRNPLSDLCVHGNKHIAFSVSDMDSLLADFARNRVDIAMIVNESFGRGCFVRDCAGNLIEIVQR